VKKLKYKVFLESSKTYINFFRNKKILLKLAHSIVARQNMKFNDFHNSGCASPANGGWKPSGATGGQSEPQGMFSTSINT
jgi:hypothetical protein